MNNYGLQKKYSIKFGSNESNIETVSNEYVKRQCINVYRKYIKLIVVSVRI